MVENPVSAAPEPKKLNSFITEQLNVMMQTGEINNQTLDHFSELLKIPQDGDCLVSEEEIKKLENVEKTANAAIGQIKEAIDAIDGEIMQLVSALVVSALVYMFLIKAMIEERDENVPLWTQLVFGSHSYVLVILLGYFIHERLIISKFFKRNQNVIAATKEDEDDWQTTMTSQEFTNRQLNFIKLLRGELNEIRKKCEKNETCHMCFKSFFVLLAVFVSFVSCRESVKSLSKCDTTENEFHLKMWNLLVFGGILGYVVSILKSYEWKFSARQRYEVTMSNGFLKKIE